MDASPLRLYGSRVIEATEDSRLVPSVVLTGHGRLNRIKVEDRPLPHDIKDDHVEVQVFYCGLNFTDNYLRLGIIRNEEFPIIMGSECCGVVIRLGAGVDDLEVGQRVLCLRMQGGLFRHVVHVPRKYCFTLPNSISLTDTIALALDCLVAYFCLFELGRLRREAVVFMQSLGGGVGAAVAQLARTVPYVTVLGTASESKHDKLWCLGVNRVYRHEDNYVERILRMYPEGADIVIVRSGGTDTERDLKLLKPCGRLITIGSDSTVTYPRTITMALKRPTWETKYISTAELVNKNVAVAGLNIGDFIEHNPQDVQTILDNLLDLHRQDRMKPHIHSMRPFERVADALELLCRRQNFGKVVLRVQDENEHTVAFGWRVPTPPKPIPRAITWETIQQRVLYKVVSKRKLKYQEKKTKERVEEEVEEEEEEEEEGQEAGEEDESFTEYEASVAAEMAKAISESGASPNISF